MCGGLEVVDFGLWVVGCGFWAVGFGFWVLSLGFEGWFYQREYEFPQVQTSISRTATSLMSFSALPHFGWPNIIKLTC